MVVVMAVTCGVSLISGFGGLMLVIGLKQVTQKLAKKQFHETSYKTFFNLTGKP